MSETTADRSARIFHESWYRVANQRVSLRSTIRIHRQLYRGETWHVLFDPFTNRYFRLQPAAYDFVVRLVPDRTIEQTWIECLELFPDQAPGQGEVIEILAQLYQANMLHYELAEDSRTLFERHRTREKSKVRSTLANILFLRIPLVDPDPLLRRMLPLIRAIFSRGGLLLWLLATGFGLKFALDHWEAVRDQAQGVLAPSNLVLLYAASFAIKLIHESGHAFAVRRYGGEVHAMGVMFMMLAPLPYTDATASWSFREKHRRVLVGAAGMLFEFFVAGCAAIVWSQLGGGPWKSLAYNVMFISSVTTILFNFNPLMKFDGYYILADLLDMPNLQKHSQEHLRYLVERHAFGRRDATSPARSSSDAWILGLYGILSTAYKFVLFGGILIAISQHYLLLAVVMGCFLAATWLVVPVVKFVRWIFVSPQLARVRRRAVRTTLGTLGAAISVAAFLPVPDTFTAPGVVLARQREVLVNRVGGRVTRLLAGPGSAVRAGDTLLVLENPVLDDRIREAQAAIRESEDKFRQNLETRPEDLLPLSRRIEALEAELASLIQDRIHLAVVAPIDGVWASPYALDLSGRWLPKGDSLGEVIDTSAWDFVAAIPQEDVSRLFSSPPRGLSARLKGAAGNTIALPSVRAIPMERMHLPSAALGWFGGGDIEVDQSGGDATRTVEPFYEVRAPLPREAAPMLAQGRSGKIRFALGWTPLLPQGWRRLRQQVQKYYRL